MASEAKIEFDSERANQYNLDIRKAIPGYEALHSMALSLLQVNLIHGDKSLPYFAKFTQAWKTFYFSQLDKESKIKVEQDFQTSIDNSIYFIPEARIIELLSTAGFSQIAKFYNAFLFGAWSAKFIGG
jgi:hypothetical protein